MHCSNRSKHATRLVAAGLVLTVLGSAMPATAQSTRPETGPSTQPATQPSTQASQPSPALQLANRYGFAQWDRIAELRFTFDVTLPNGKRVVRHWTWDTQTHGVTRTLPDGSEVSFTAYAPETDEQKQADQQFINDTYWLLFPFQLVWSRPAISTPRGGPYELPIGDGDASTKLICRYGNDEGYTPGDTYALYLDGSGMITQWEFIRGDNANAMTWERDRRLGPITVSTLHRNADASFEMNLLDGLGATLTDGTVVEPEPVE